MHQQTGNLIALDAGPSGPPTSFRIFPSGIFATSKGSFLFDAEAARSVMADYELRRVDVAIDFAHAMIQGGHADPATANRAAGWFKLEMRGGELWAVDVRWTPAASAMVLAGEYRYFSPAFAVDDSQRPTRLINVALTNLPATHEAEALIAASSKGGEYLPTRAEIVNGYVTPDGVDVPGEETMRALGFEPGRAARDAFISVQRDLIAEGSLEAASRTEHQRQMVELAAAHRPCVVLHNGRKIEVPCAADLKILGMTYGTFVKTQMQMIDEGVL